MNGQPSVSVIVCAHTMDRLEDIRDAIASVQAQTLEPVETLLVIDYNDELQEAVKDFGVKVVSNHGPKGLSGARNTGTELATGDLVAYLDDDATAEPTWLAELTAPFAKPSVMAVGGWAIAAWRDAQPAWFPEEFLWVVGCSHRGLPETLAPVRNVIGCNMAFRRQAVLDLGGFEVGLGRTSTRPLGCEETELCIRLRQADPAAEILLAPAARIHHRVPAQRGTWSYFFSRCRGEGNSKAYVVGLVGSDDGLSSERSYVTSVLPKAVLRALGSTVRQPLSSLQTIAAIVGGLGATGAGYLEMKYRMRS